MHRRTTDRGEAGDAGLFGGSQKKPPQLERDLNERDGGGGGEKVNSISFLLLYLTVQSSSGNKSSSSGISSSSPSPSPTEAAGGVEGDEANAATSFNCRRRSIGGVGITAATVLLAACLGAFEAIVHREEHFLDIDVIFVDALIAIRQGSSRRVEIRERTIFSFEKIY